MNRLFKAINIKNQYIKYRLPSFQSEMYLIKWFPNARTEKHNHDGKNCDYIPLKGNLFEKRFNILLLRSPAGTTLLGLGYAVPEAYPILPPSAAICG